MSLVLFFSIKQAHCFNMHILSSSQLIYKFLKSCKNLCNHYCQCWNNCKITQCLLVMSNTLLKIKIMIILQFYLQKLNEFHRCKSIISQTSTQCSLCFYFYFIFCCTMYKGSMHARHVLSTEHPVLPLNF